MVDDSISRPTLDEEDGRIPETEGMSCIKPVDAEDEVLSEPLTDHEFSAKTKELCPKALNVKDKRPSESYTDLEFSAKTEELRPKVLDVKDERLPESDTDEDVSAKNVDPISQGHSHNEMWSTTLEGAVNWKGSRVVNSGLNLLGEYEKGTFQ